MFAAAILTSTASACADPNRLRTQASQPTMDPGRTEPLACDPRAFAENMLIHQPAVSGPTDTENPSTEVRGNVRFVMDNVHRKMGWFHTHFGEDRAKWRNLEDNFTALILQMQHATPAAPLNLDDTESWLFDPVTMEVATGDDDRAPVVPVIDDQGKVFSQATADRLARAGAANPLNRQPLRTIACPMLAGLVQVHGEKMRGAPLPPAAASAPGDLTVTGGEGGPFQISRNATIADLRRRLFETSGAQRVYPHARPSQQIVYSVGTMRGLRDRGDMDDRRVGEFVEEGATELPVEMAHWHGAC